MAEKDAVGSGGVEKKEKRHPHEGFFQRHGFSPEDERLLFEMLEAEDEPEDLVYGRVKKKLIAAGMSRREADELIEEWRALRG